MSFNQATLIGNVGRDPEIRSMNNGDRVASFSLATSERWKDKDGNRKEATEWLNIVVFNQGLVGVIEQFVAKGSQIMVQGQIKTRKWQDKDGKDRWSTEIVLGRFNGTMTLLGKREGGGERYEGGEHGYGTQRDGSGGSGGFSGQDNRGNPREDFQADLDDEIPF